MLWCAVMKTMNARMKAMVVLAVASASMFTFAVPMAGAADGANGGVVTSARSFPKLNATRVDLLVESASVSVDSASFWDSESLNVPQTKSQAEKDAEAKAQAEAEAKAKAEEAAKAAAAAQASAASRASSRSAISSSQSGSSSASGTSSSSSAAQSTAASATTSASGTAAAVIAYALQYQGVPYVTGGTTPSGWDCSGFTSYVFGHFGISLARTSDGQRGSGTRVSDPQPGDIMWKPGHVGIYMGGGKMIHATKPGDVTKVSSTSWYSGWEYYRVL